MCNSMCHPLGGTAELRDMLNRAMYVYGYSGQERAAAHQPALLVLTMNVACNAILIMTGCSNQ